MNLKRIKGLGMILGGGYLLSKVSPNKLTGKVVRYHNTEEDNVPNILKNGIKTSYSNDPKNLTNSVLRDIPEKEKRGIIYTSKKKSVADIVGKTRQKRLGEPGKTLKLVFNYDDIKDSPRVKNPELRGTDNPKDYWNKKPNRKKDYDQLSSKEKRLVNKNFEGLDKDTHIFNKDIDPSHIVGSDSYKGRSTSDVINYIKNNPRRFGKEIFKLGSGTALLRYGLKNIKLRR